MPDLDALGRAIAAIRGEIRRDQKKDKKTPRKKKEKDRKKKTKHDDSTSSSSWSRSSSRSGSGQDYVTWKPKGRDRSVSPRRLRALDSKRFKARAELLAFAATHPGALSGHCLAMIHEKLGRGTARRTGDLCKTSVAQWVTSFGGCKDVRDLREAQTLGSVMDAVNRDSIARQWTYWGRGSLRSRPRRQERRPVGPRRKVWSWSRAPAQGPVRPPSYASLHEACPRGGTLRGCDAAHRSPRLLDRRFVGVVFSGGGSHWATPSVPVPLQSMHATCLGHNIVPRTLCSLCLSCQRAAIGGCGPVTTW